MAELLLVFILTGLALIAAVLAVRASSHRAWQRQLVAYRLQFPRGLDAAAVVAFLAGVSGLVAPRARRPFVARAVAVEITGTSQGIDEPKAASVLAEKCLAVEAGERQRVGVSDQVVAPASSALGRRGSVGIGRWGLHVADRTRGRCDWPAAKQTLTLLARTCSQG